jgi:hypothetical protein
MGAALAHLLRADSHNQGQSGQEGTVGTDQVPVRSDRSDTGADQVAHAIRRDRLADADAAATRLVAAEQRVSRRTLRASGLRGSNAELGELARIVKSRSLMAGLKADNARRMAE